MRFARLGAGVAAGAVVTAAALAVPAYMPDTANAAVRTLSSQACSTATLVAFPASPGATGSTVQLTAGASACANPMYRFWIWPPGGKWQIVQDYSASNTHSWTIPNTGLAGLYHIEVDVRDAADAAVSYETVANITYTLSGCTAASISGSPASPVKFGTTVQLTATATCPVTPNYRWWIKAPGDKWRIYQDYGEYVLGYPNRFTWNASGWLYGTYGIEVDVRDQGSTEVYETVYNTTYAVVPITCGDPGYGTGAIPVVTAVSPNYGSVDPTQVTITGCGFTGATAVAFYNVGPAGPVTVVSDSTITATSPRYLVAPGDPRTPGESFPSDVTVTTPLGTSPLQPSDRFTFFWPGAPCSTAGLTASPPSPSSIGTTVTLTGSTFTCTSPQYRFWVRPYGGMWRIAQDYSSANTYGWTVPVTGTSGTYYLEVDVRNAGETVSYDKVANISYVLNGCSTASLSTNPTSPQPHGTPITLTAGATCPGTATYRFWVRAPGGAWQIVRDYGSSSTFLWTPAAAGAYALEVDVRDQGASASYETVANITFVAG